MNKKRIYLLLSALLSGLSATAQHFNVQGRVTDSLQTGIPRAIVKLYAGRDTLFSTTDDRGYFRFNAFAHPNFGLSVRSMGYSSYTGNFYYSGAGGTMDLPALVLHPVSMQLQEIVIKAPPPAMQVRGDTVEYNAGAYIVREQDRLEDLLKQLPGLRVDANGQVTAMGEPMTHLRVNGKDFFTANVRDFLNRLPAGIIEKLQVIDDYGDEANFSGIKKGKPQKMLNLVIKEGKSKGIFGTLSGSVGTNNQNNIGAVGNLWRNVNQLGANITHNRNRTEQGNQQGLTTGFNYRLQQDNNLNLYSTYNYGKDRKQSDFQNYTESITGLGILKNQLKNTAQTDNQSNQLQLTAQHRTNRDFINAQFGGTIGNTTGENQMISKQRGVIFQDQNTGTTSKSQSRSGNMALSWSRNMKKPGRNLNVQFSVNAQAGKVHSIIADQLRYYDQATEEVLKDSVDRRQLDGQNTNTSWQLEARFTEPLRSRASAKNRSLDFHYRYAANKLHNEQVAGREENTIFQRVDSLSNAFESLLSTHQLDITYRVTAPKYSYDVGATIMPVQMRGTAADRAGNVSYGLFKILPIAGMRYQLSKKDNITFNYMGNTAPPSVNQLLPLKDVRNLQNITVGNPDLKPAVQHTLVLGLNRADPLKGSTYNLSFIAGMTQDQVVSELLLLPDTLNSLRQETHFRNANGAYHLGGSYAMTLPFSKIVRFQYRSDLSFNRAVSFVDGVEGFNRSLSFSQNTGLMINTQKIALTGSVNYSLASNAYQLDSTIRTTITTWDFQGDVRYTFSPHLVAGFNGSYRINKGYTVAINNPVFIGAYTELFFTKRKEASIRLQVYDLLDQQQSVYQSVVANIKSQKTMNRIGRYFMLTANFNLSRFGDGGK